MMTIATLSKYAEATGNTLEIVGDHSPLRLMTHPATGKKELISFTYRHYRGHVAIKDVRTGNHWVSYLLDSDGSLWCFARRNWINGATQKTWNKEYSFTKHVEATINA